MEANWQVSKTLVQIHHVNKLRESKIVHKDLDLLWQLFDFMRLMLKFFHNKVSSITDDN